MKYLASVVSLIFLAKTLIWNKIMFPVSNSLNLAELVVNEPMKSITNIPLTIRFITALPILAQCHRGYRTVTLD